VPWLLVFDNVDVSKEENIIDRFWPAGAHGSILLTARNEAALGQFTGTIEVVGNLDESDAVDLLLNLSKKPDNHTNRESAQKICSRIASHPLAVSSVAGLVKSNQTSLDEYLEQYTNIDLIMKSKPMAGPEAPYKFSLATVWSAQFASLEAEPLLLLNILSFLDPDGMQEKFFSEGAQKSGLSILRKFASSKKLSTMRENLCTRGLIFRNEDIRKMWMHRLIQDYCHFRMDRSAFQNAFYGAFNLIANTFPVPERHHRHNPELWPAQQGLIHHIQRLAECYHASQMSEDNGDEEEIYKPLMANRDLAELWYNGAW
jgi:hypothetical protein